MCGEVLGRTDVVGGQNWGLKHFSNSGNHDEYVGWGVFAKVRCGWPVAETLKNVWPISWGVC